MALATISALQPYVRCAYMLGTYIGYAHARSDYVTLKDEKRYVEMKMNQTKERKRKERKENKWQKKGVRSPFRTGDIIVSASKTTHQSSYRRNQQKQEKITEEGRRNKKRK